jgi:hypothetical protein
VFCLYGIGASLMRSVRRHVREAWSTSLAFLAAALPLPIAYSVLFAAFVGSYPLNLVWLTGYLYLYSVVAIVAVKDFLDSAWLINGSITQRVSQRRRRTRVGRRPAIDVRAAR